MSKAKQMSRSVTSGVQLDLACDILDIGVVAFTLLNDVSKTEAVSDVQSSYSRLTHQTKNNFAKN